MLNIPFFFTFVENSWQSVLLVLGRNDVLSWFTSMKDHIDEDEKLFIDAFLVFPTE